MLDSPFQHVGQNRHLRTSCCQDIAASMRYLDDGRDKLGKQGHTGFGSERPVLPFENRRRGPHRSSTIAMASPPPMQRVASPWCTSFSFMECNSVTTMRFPEQPIGWPRATAPPQMLKTSHGMPSSFLTPTLAEENASLCSTKSNSSSFIPVRCISFRTQGIGANITSSGFTAWEQKPRIVPSGSTPISRALRSLISTVALAPSEIWDELPAVSTPSFLNTSGEPTNASLELSGQLPAPPVVVSLLSCRLRMRARGSLANRA